MTGHAATEDRNMFHRHLGRGRWGWLVLATVFVVVGCASAEETGNLALIGDEPQSQGVEERPSSEPVVGSLSSREQADEFEGTELWLFGTRSPRHAAPFDAKGFRVILDLRSLNVDQSIRALDELAD